MDLIAERFGDSEVLLFGEGELVPDVELDLVLALGGDGTVLRALVAFPGVPVLAINYGNVGFLTQADKGSLEEALDLLESGSYFVEERVTLQIEHDGGLFRSINELVVKGANRMIVVDVALNDRLVHSPRGDGIIVGTPTGSTAYLLSTGAPLVVPDADCMIIKPLNEYRFSSRTIVVSGDTRLQLTVRKERENSIGMCIDGGELIPLEDGAVIDVCRSPIPARLVCFEPDYFFRNLKERLSW
jgi:NAD+ kinase